MRIRYGRIPLLGLPLLLFSLFTCLATERVFILKNEGRDRPVQDPGQTGRGQTGRLLQRPGFPRYLPRLLDRHEAGQYPLGL